MFRKILTESLSIVFTFFGLVMLGANLKEVVIQGLANLEEKVGINPFAAEHLI